MTRKEKKIFVCATEQSGDNIGKEVIKELFKINSSLKIDGVGGSKMKPLLNKQLYSLEFFKAMGIVEVLFSINKYIKLINKISNYIVKNNFDLVITIDSPDFNYPLSKKIKKIGYKGKIIQIVAPTVWAWREYRAKRFANVYDEIFTLFNFENKYFEKYNLKTTFIGNPIFNKKLFLNKNKFKKYIAFLPGSRMGEIKSLFKFYQIAYEYLNIKNSKYKIFIPTLPHLEKEILLRTKNWTIETSVITRQSDIKRYFANCRFALVCSGTASLEIAMRGIPQLVLYKLNLITEIIVKILVKVKYANIINILANKMIIPELVNSNLNKKNFLKDFDNLLNNRILNDLQIKEVNKIVNKMVNKKDPFIIAATRIKNYL